MACAIVRRAAIEEDGCPRAAGFRAGGFWLEERHLKTRRLQHFALFCAIPAMPRLRAKDSRWIHYHRRVDDLSPVTLDAGGTAVADEGIHGHERNGVGNDGRDTAYPKRLIVAGHQKLK